MSRVVAALAPYALAAVVGALIWTWTPLVGSHARYGRLEARHDLAVRSARAWEQHAQGWQASFRVAETIREGEQKASRAAVAQLADQCDARVSEARRSTRIIEHIVTKEPTYDENRCPVRSLVDPDQLRSALRPSR